jgi:hypothetical protein
MSPTDLTDEAIDELLEPILRASGSSLRHYSMASTIAAMRQAMRDAISRALAGAS